MRLTHEEKTELAALLREAFSSHLQDAIANLIILLNTALERTQQDLGVTKQKPSELRRNRLDIDNAMKALEAGQKQYLPNVERLRAFIERELYLPELLCEVAEVIDESWQTAIEAMLGRRRFHLLVEPEDYRQAVRLLDVARREQKIYDVSILDAEKVYAQRRPAKANSLAMYIDSENIFARAYLDSVLGNIIACDSVDELRNFERSVTREVVVYSEWSVSATDPEKFKTWYIGSRARASQLATLREQLETVREEILALSPREASLETTTKLLNREGPLTELKLGLAERLETADLEAELVEVERELAALDVSGLEALRAEVERLRAEQERYRQRTQELFGKQRDLERDLETIRYRLTQALEATKLRRLERDELNEHHPDLATTLEKELTERLAQEDWNGELRKVEIKMQEFQTKAENEKAAFLEIATRFNTQHQFAANVYDVNEPRYKAELERLQTSELPKYQSEIEKRHLSAEQELREHVLSKLFEQFDEAQRLLKQMNDALQVVDFRGERYRFRAEARDGELGEFYRLIKDWQPTLAVGAERSEQNALFEQFYQTFSRLPRDDLERQEQEKLKDYRHYLDYEIMVSYPDGREERFSRIMAQTSGGETQTPFYLTIAASFVQEYKPRFPGRPTLRLVVFDEAFSKMDQDRIGAALELFQAFGLQLVIATPLDRSVYIVPKMQTNLVLSRIGSRGVYVDSYHNYAAQLGGG